MTKKIFRSIITVAMIVLLSSLSVAIAFVYEYFADSQVESLKKELTIVSKGVLEEGVAYFENFDSSVFRFTLVSSDGTVLYDSRANAAEMENHSNRAEIKKALAFGKGSDSRYSSTLTQKTVYEAILLENGNVLRVSVNQLTVGAMLIRIMPAVSAIILIAIVISLLLSDKMARLIVKPLNDLDLDDPANNQAYEELEPILAKLNTQHKQIKKQMSQIKRKSDELEQIMSSMKEGLVLLDKKAAVISMNPAAKNFFGIENALSGVQFHSVYQNDNIERAIEKALSGKHSEFRQEKDGSEYQFIINHIETDKRIAGVLILILDVSEIAFSERNRREFTANVSHELKTPLQSIIGSAELLENGLVRPEDTNKFIGNIKKEASRLVTLINDIIRLSQMDENLKPEYEYIDLYEIAREVIELLSNSASKKKVNIELKGSFCEMKGIRRYIYEIIYNLCDNGIRYNKEGGKVVIDISKKNHTPVLVVSDTGIGIPIEHQSRIFQRFYRVDKSHSKETGGTGLGLSIVKHAVAVHNGTLKLESSADKGSVITITF